MLDYCQSDAGRLFSRRRFIASSAFVSLLAAPSFGVENANGSGFFALGQRGNRWWLITPDGKPFFTLGLNHIDPTPLRYSSNGDLWQRKYGNSMERWLKESVAPDLKAWGFNSVGWTQEVVTRGPTNHRHSRPFTYEEYQWLNLPYCHMLPFADFHQWEFETKNPDFKSPEFADWCDYVARENCARMANDPKLMGYFYIDCPTWIHTTPDMKWKGPLFDPEQLKSTEGREKLFELATDYYRVTHDAIRRYDKHHLIFGDRYEAKRAIAEEVIAAAKPFVDVLSFQHFGDADEIAKNLTKWHEQTGKPVLLADYAVQVNQADGSKRHDGAAYAEIIERLRELPGCIGSHLCGAYLKNEARKRALRDAAEGLDAEAVTLITQANQETMQWMKSF